MEVFQLKCIFRVLFSMCNINILWEIIVQRLNGPYMFQNFCNAYRKLNTYETIFIVILRYFWHIAHISIVEWTFMKSIFSGTVPLKEASVCLKFETCSSQEYTRLEQIQTKCESYRPWRKREVNFLYVYPILHYICCLLKGF